MALSGSLSKVTDRLHRYLGRILWSILRAPLFLLIATAGTFGGGIRIDPSKVAIYIRWSTDDQSEGTTLDVQRDACLNQAKAWGWGTVPDNRIFIDEGYSGGTLERPAMTRLRKLVKSGQVQCVIVYKIDRLSRNIVDATGLVLREWDGVCHLRCVQEPIDTTSELGRVIFSILATFADFERSTIKTRTFSGKVRRAGEGRNPGIRLPYGYKVGSVPGSIEIEEAQAAVVRQIFNWYATGHGMQKISQMLNQQGVAGVRGGKWGITTLQYLMQNQAYVGQMLYGRTRKDPHRGKNVRVRQEPLVDRGDSYPPIIAPDLWERCTQIRTQRATIHGANGSRGIDTPYLLTGLAYCRCGSRLQVHKGANKKRTTYYGCRERWARGPGVCNSGAIPQEELDAFVVQQLMELRVDDMQRRLREAQSSASQNKQADLQERVAACDRELAELDAQDRRNTRDLRSQKLTPESYERVRSDIERDRLEQAALRQRLEVDLVQSDAKNTAQGDIEYWLSQLEGLEHCEIPEKKQIIRNLVERITVFREVRDRGPITVDELRYKGLPPEQNPA